MARLEQLLEHQKRFVRDTSHQLRTPLAVLKAQVQSALRGDAEPQLALREISRTVEDATQLANQMLALAKVEQLRLQSDAPVTDWDSVARAVALDLSALIAQRHLEFAIDAAPASVRAHEWALRELTRNLLHNAIRHAPAGSHLTTHLVADGRHAALTISDCGPGISAEQRVRLFQPFATGAPADADAHAGSGLGLAICHEIVRTLGGSISLDNREQHGRVVGLDAVVRLPLASP
jgi:two-component system sensor histidine kinase TctE